MCSPGRTVSCKARNVCPCGSCSPLYTSIQSSPGYCENKGICLMRLSHKRRCNLYLTLSWITHCGGSQLPCCEGIQGAQWRGPHCKDAQTPYKEVYIVREYSPLPTTSTNLLDVWASYPQSSVQTTAVPAAISAVNSWRNMSHNHLVKMPLAHRNCRREYLLF